MELDFPDKYIEGQLYRYSTTLYVKGRAGLQGNLEQFKVIIYHSKAIQLCQKYTQTAL